MTEDATEKVEAETLPIDEESGEIDYEKVNQRKEAADKVANEFDAIKAAIIASQDMPITEVIAFSIACGIIVTILAFVLLSIAAVIATIFTSGMTLVASFGLGAAIPFSVLLLLKFIYKLKKGKNV